jgi:tRNA-modifying protein YgfZ
MLMMDVSFEPQTRPDRAVVRVAGEAALAFLNNLLTADLNAGQPAYAALLTPQGKILHDVFVVPDGDTVWVDVATTQAAALVKRLIMYRLRARLDFALDDSKTVMVSSANGLKGLAYADPRTVDMGFRSISDTRAPVGGNRYDAARILHGLADSVADIGSGEMFVHEANLDQLQGVSFAKGCYVGQEVVSRTQHRGTARNRILPVTFAGEAMHGAEIASGDKRVGTLLSQTENHALALIRLDRLSEATAPLLCNGHPVAVQRPAWAKFDLNIPEIAQ